MPNTQVENYLLNTSNEKFNGIWQLTRAMKNSGWRYKASANASTQDSSSNPNNDLWGGGVQVGAQTGGGGFTIGTPTSTSFGGRSVITNLPGATFTATSTGHFLKIVGASNAGNNGTFLITNFNSATSVTIENPNAVNETVGVGGGQSWTELSALLDTYPASISGGSGSGAWWCGQGPSTLKVPIGSTTPTGTFLRGENVSQSVSGATAEFLGIVTDTATGTGYMVLSPRLSGTSAGVRGWSSLVTSTITGSKSGATITPTATIIEYVREVVFWKNNTTTGHIYFQVIDSVNEAALTSTNGRFSTMAASVTTATQAPGGANTGNPTTNGFPTTGTYCVLGEGGANVASTAAQDLFSNTAAVNAGKLQILLANMIEDALISADGTCTLVAGTPATGTTTYIGLAFHRVDDQEPGDVDPFVWFSTATNTAYGRTRTNNPQIALQSAGDFMYGFNVATQFPTYFLGWRRRGWATGDTWFELGGSCLAAGGSAVITLTSGTQDTVACNAATVHVREPIWVASTQNFLKQRKGSLRWWFMVQGNSGNDTYDTKRWIQTSSQANGPLVIGPADGTTTPVNQ